MLRGFSILAKMLLINVSNKGNFPVFGQIEMSELARQEGTTRCPYPWDSGWSDFWFTQTGGSLTALEVRFAEKFCALSNL
jgi:hypothetical protein